MNLNFDFFIHNLIAHPLMGFSRYSEWSLKLHDKTVDMVFDDSEKEIREINVWDYVHNCLAHPLIALSLNSKWSIRFHDWTGDKMPEGKSELKRNTL